MSLQRIEAALERLEAAAKQPSPKVVQLQASNAKLREAITSSIAQIDAVIARNGGEPLA